MPALSLSQHHAILEWHVCEIQSCVGPRDRVLDGETTSDMQVYTFPLRSCSSTAATQANKVMPPISTNYAPVTHFVQQLKKEDVCVFVFVGGDGGILTFHLVRCGVWVFNCLLEIVKQSKQIMSSQTGDAEHVACCWWHNFYFWWLRIWRIGCESDYVEVLMLEKSWWQNVELGT